MKTQIIKQKKNPFLQREEIVMEIASETAPSFADVKSAIGKDENPVVVKRIDGNFGKQVFTAEVFVYESEDAKNNVEVIPKKIKKKMEEEKKAAEEATKKAEEEKKKSEESSEEVKEEKFE